MCKTCSICYENVNNEFKTFCNHIFCKSCIIEWASKKNTCPLCREKNVLFKCKNCKKIKSEKNNEIFCRDCIRRSKYNKTDSMCEISNIKKLQRDLKRRYKKLPLIKRIKIRIKSIRLRRIIKKSGLTLYQIITMLLGTYEFKNTYEEDGRTPYHFILTVLYGIGASLIPGGLPIVTASLMLIAIYNGGMGLYYMSKDESTRIHPINY